MMTKETVNHLSVREKSQVKIKKKKKRLESVIPILYQTFKKIMTILFYYRKNYCNDTCHSVNNERSEFKCFLIPSL